MVTAQRAAGVRILGVVAVIALIAVGCGSSDDDGGSSSDASGGSTTTTVPCPGKPIKLTSIISLTGPVTIPSATNGTQDGYEVALKAVNGSCQIGRPLEIDVCDEQSTPNGSTRCGR